MAIKHVHTAVPDEVIQSAFWNADHTGTLPTADHGNEAHTPDFLSAESDPVFTAWDKDHADLSNVTSDQHHARAHNLTSAIDHLDVEVVGLADANILAYDLATEKWKNVSAPPPGIHGNESHDPDFLSAESDPVFIASEAFNFVLGDKAKLNGIEAGAEVNNISDLDATDLTDGGDTILHDHDGISENTAARHTKGADTTLGAMTADINMNSNYQLINLQAPAANGEAIRQTAKITEALLESATDLKHSQNTDTALGSGCVAADHGTAATDQVINVCYGTGAPPDPATMTEGALFVKYTA